MVPLPFVQGRAESEVYVYQTIGYAAKKLAITRETCRALLKSGDLAGFRLPSGVFRVDAEDLEDFPRRNAASLSPDRQSE